MGEMVSGLRFWKTAQCHNPRDQHGLHGPRGSSDPTGRDPHPGLSWSCAITRTREDDRSGPPV